MDYIISLFLADILKELCYLNNYLDVKFCDNHKFTKKWGILTQNPKQWRENKRETYHKIVKK